MRSRRLVFQLTPLLDLLIIVIFAQYMDVRAATRHEIGQIHRQADAAVSEVERARREALGLARQRLRQADENVKAAEQLKDSVMNELTEKAKTIATLRGEVEELRRDLLSERNQREEAERQARRDLLEIGRIAAEALNIDEETLRLAVKDLPAEEKRTIRRQLEDMRGKTPAAIVRHLRKVAEIRKRCDVWEIHVGDDDSVRLKYNGKPVARGVFVKSADEVTALVKDTVQDNPEPKSLVLLIYTWSNATAKVRNMYVRPGIEAARGLLDDLYDRKKTFVVSVLGYDAQAP